MTYERLTELDLRIEEVPIMAINEKTVYGKQVPQLAEALYESCLAVQNYQEVLEAVGIKLESTDPDEYNIEEMDADIVLALLTTIVRRDRFCEGTLAACLESGLLGELLGRLEAIDYENQPLPAWIESIVDKTLVALQHFPSDGEITPGRAIQPYLSYKDDSGKRHERVLSMQDEFDITDALYRKAKDYGLYLDNSAYADMLTGLPINIPFRVRKLSTESNE